MSRIFKFLTLFVLAALVLSACQPVVAQPSVQTDTLAANKDFILRYFAALNKDKSAATVDEFTTDEVLKQHIELFEAAFPGYQLTAEEMIAEGDQVFVRTTFTGTHEGDLMGIAPTGKEVTIDIALTYKIENGEIVDHWMLADQLSLMQQLGVIPAQ
ncbi:MAG: ester cyclase [Caldilineaceae bacterium]